MLRIAHLITGLDTGGAEIMLARLLEAPGADDLDQTVISMTTIGPVGERIARRGIPVHALEMSRGSGAVGIFRLHRILQTLRPDLLQTWLYHADLVGLLTGRFAQVRRIVWNIRCSSFDFDDHSRSFAVLLRVLAKASRFPDAIVFNSRSGLAAHERMGYRARRAVVIPNGFDVEVFHPSRSARALLRARLGVSETTAVVGHLARFHPMKDHATFLKAAAVVLNVRPDAHFVAAGRDIDTRLSETVSHLGLASRVTLWSEQSDPSTFLAGLDLAVSSSYSEGFPNVVAEAMACGVPCVATDVGDSAEIVGRTGRVVAPRDPDALARAILDYLQLDDSSRRELSSSARARIVEEFSMQRAVSRYSQFYVSVTRDPARCDRSSECAG